MQQTQLIKEIELYLSVYDFKKSSGSHTPKNNPKNNLHQQNMDINNAIAKLSYAKEKDADYSDMLNSVLEHCTPEVLDEVISAYGEDSELAQIIRRKNAERYRKVTCEVDKLEKPIAEKLRDSKYENPFYEAICEHMERLGYKTDADFYNSISMPRQQFARLRDPSNNLSKKTVLWIIVGLRLDYPRASDLLQKAGYSFRKNDMRDVILTYIFRNTIYDLDMVNQILDHFGVDPFI